MISSTRTGTVQQRWLEASKALRKEGVQFRFNVSKCCRGCITAEDLNLKDESQPYGYTYGGQGNRIHWDEQGRPYTKGFQRHSGPWHETMSRAYINHGNGSAPRIVAAFRAAGLDASWDGSQYSCVEVNFSA